MSKLSQVGIIGLMASVVIFVIIIEVVATDFLDMESKVKKRAVFEEMQIASIEMLNALVRTPGQPVSWESDPQRAEIIGLQEQQNILSAKKVEELTKLSYGKVKEVFNIGKYGYYISIMNVSSREVLGSSGIIGGEGDRVAAARLAVFNDTIVEVKIIIWS